MDFRSLHSLMILKDKSFWRGRLLNEPFVHVALIVAAVFLSYSNTFDVPFQFDDVVNIADNPAIRDLSLFSDMTKMEQTRFPEYLSTPLLKTRFIGYLTFALNFAVHGLDVRGYHLVNILIHAVNSLLIYRLLFLTFGTPFFSGDIGGKLSSVHGLRGFIALFPSILFALHPIQTQAVTYIVQRFASLAAMFYLLALVLYIDFRVSAGKGSTSVGFSDRRFARACALYMTSLLSAILAMKTKELAFTLPVVMVLYEIMFFGGDGKKRALYLVPFALTMLIIPLSLTGISGPLSGIDKLDESAASMSGAKLSISRWDYLNTQFRVIVTYIRLLVFPVNQNFDYDYPVYTSFFTPEIVMSFLFLMSFLGFGAYLDRLSRNNETEDRYWARLTSFGIFWFFVTMSAESSIIPIKDVIFEHRVYLPSAGFFIAMTSGLVLLGRRWPGRISRANGTAAMFLVVITLAGAAYARNNVWRDAVSLSEDNARKSPNKARPHYHLGLAYFEKGRLDDAVGAYKTALSLNPEYFIVPDIYNNLGIIYDSQGRTDEAVGAYEAALKNKPYDADICFNLAGAYARKGRYEDAVREYKTAISLSPDDPKLHYYLGAAYAKQGLKDAAIIEYETVVRLNPGDAGTRRRIEMLRGEDESAMRNIRR